MFEPPIGNLGETALQTPSAPAPISTALVFGVAVALVSALLIRRARTFSMARALAAGPAEAPAAVPVDSTGAGRTGKTIPGRETPAAPAPRDAPDDAEVPSAAPLKMDAEFFPEPAPAEGAAAEPLHEAGVATAERQLVVTAPTARAAGQLFGVTQLQVDGRPVSFSRAEGRDLFALLAASKDGELQETVIERLWPDEAGERGVRHLETGVRDINAALRQATGLSAGMKFVVKTGRRRHLPAAYFDIDLWRFEEAHLQASTAIDDQARVQALRQMVALYRGPLFADREDLWCLPLRQSAASQAMNAIMRLADLERRTEPEHALDLLTLAVERIDPYDEVVWCQIMTIQGELGRLAAVHKTFRRLTDRLNEIDEQPGRQARRTYERIVN
ncbi:AfsR/SARP family transcriptional regulator [Planomonospora parontospora]|uniref:AfsR/SARP family transcriptional regulator n=1 Tax=Planomonospora parontospora TaxID=58119 RepID=UPI001670217D|nr:BTAD domain-containing putative transcriptional regulator [Planomonospora parontospora]